MAFGWDDALGLAIGIGGKLLAGKKQNDATAAINDQNLEWAREQQSRNEALQREFAQNGVRWRVEDAKAAGLHPLYAVGAAGASYSPAPIGLNLQAKTGYADAFGSMGQDLSKALKLQQSPHELQMQKLNEELLHQQVLLTQAQRQAIESNTSANQNVAMSYPAPGQRVDAFPLVINATNGRVFSADQNARTDTGVYKVKPQEVPTSKKGQPGILPAASPGYLESAQPDGMNILVPAQGDQRMDEISAIDFIPWLRANMAVNPTFIGEYLFGKDLYRELVKPRFGLNPKGSTGRRRPSSGATFQLP